MIPDKEQHKMLAEAVSKAQKAFQDTIHKKYGYDCAYFRCNITVQILSVDAFEPIYQIEHKDLG